MENILISLQNTLLQGLPDLLAACLILLVGLVVAWLLRAVAFAILDRVQVDERLDKALGGTPDGLNVRTILGQSAFGLVMVVALVAALDILELDVIALPLNNIFERFLAFVPNLLSAAVLILLAWVVATLVNKVLRRFLAFANWDGRLTQKAGMTQRVRLSHALVSLAYWLVWLLFLPAILAALNLDGLLRPVQALVQEMVAFLPNLFSAVVIFLVGYFVARLVRVVVSNLLAATGVDDWVARLRRTPSAANVPAPTSATLSFTSKTAVSSPPTNTLTPSAIVGWLVYSLILIPTAIAALAALHLEAISQPAITMLQTSLTAIPAVLTAGGLLFVAYLVARLMGDWVNRLMAMVGLNRFLYKVGLLRLLPNGRSPATLIGSLVMVVIMLLAAVEAADLLGFAAVAQMLTHFLSFLGNVVLGLIVLLLGLYLANLAVEAINASSQRRARLWATLARAAIVVLALTMALQQMGVAADIVTLAFGLLLGAVAVAAAIAFGWGGRALAQEQLEKLEEALAERPNNSLPPA